MIDQRRRHNLRRLYKVICKLWIVPLVMLGLQFTVWVFDRTSPRVIGAYTATPAAPGGAVVLTIDVKRDLSRRCSTNLIRYFYDARAVRYSVGGVETRSAIHAIYSEAMSPGKLILGFNVPPAAARGTGLLVTTLEFTCNPLHTIWPIAMVMTQEVEVL